MSDKHSKDTAGESGEDQNRSAPTAGETEQKSEPETLPVPVGDEGAAASDDTELTRVSEKGVPEEGPSEKGLPENSTEDAKLGRADTESNIDVNSTAAKAGERATKTDKQKKASSASENRVESDTSQVKKKKRSFLWVWVLLLLVLMGGAVAYAAYYGNEWLKSTQADNQAQIESLKQQQSEYAQALSALSSQLPQYGNADQALVAQLKKTEQRLAAAEQRLAVQNKRLLSISTTSRDDWLLAEAEYLLKLANQRILVERSAAGADALLSEADSILRDLGDPDLFPLRQAIAKDLAQVRLVNKIDVEGIYLQLQALSNSVETMPVKPNWDQLADNGKVEPLLVVDSAEPDQTEAAPADAELGWSKKLWVKSKAAFSTFTGKLDDYIRVRHHDVPAEPMLSPQANIYVQQNLRLVLERAQLALLREQTDIYVDSLKQASFWLKKYYPATQVRESFVEQLEALESKEIIQTLPDISGSLELLHTYIAELHQLKGVKAQSGDGQ